MRKFNVNITIRIDNELPDLKVTIPEGTKSFVTEIQQSDWKLSKVITDGSFVNCDCYASIPAGEMDFKEFAFDLAKKLNAGIGSKRVLSFEIYEVYYMDDTPLGTDLAKQRQESDLDFKKMLDYTKIMLENAGIDISEIKRKYEEED